MPQKIGKVLMMMARHIGGGGAGVVNMSDVDIESNAGAICTMLLRSNGQLRTVIDGVTVDETTAWMNPAPDAAAGALYEARRTQVSGSLGVSHTGSMISGTWYPLTSDRGTSVTAGAATRSNVSDWDIRRVSDGVIVDSWRATIVSNL